MINSPAELKSENSGVAVFEIKNNIKYHLMAAVYFKEAARISQLAAKYHEEGNDDKAFLTTVSAQENNRMAAAYHKEDIRQSLLNVEF